MNLNDFSKLYNLEDFKQTVFNLQVKLLLENDAIALECYRSFLL